MNVRRQRRRRIQSRMGGARRWIALLALQFLVQPLGATLVYLAQGTLAGEPGTDSVILQARLTATSHGQNGRVPGASGEARFEIARGPDFGASQFSPWFRAQPENDYIVRTRIRGLEPDTRYHYRVWHGNDRQSAVPGPVAQFRTLPAVQAATKVRFAILSCMHYARFMGHMPGRPNREMTPAEREKGYPGLDGVRSLSPDFVVAAGDVVYYDNPKNDPAATLERMRAKWHEQGVLLRFRQLAAEVPFFFMKDDHDFRYNDADLTGDVLPTSDLGLRVFREQVPMGDPLTPETPPFRTVRVGRYLQLWFLEGRDFRSPNRDPDGPQKSIWGAAQKAWLQRTLLKSDAAIKVIVSPTPLVGPDDASKADNHTSAQGFRHEGTEFLNWLRASDLTPPRLLLVTGDRHWKYHSVHPVGAEEWSVGSLVYENSRAGRKPGDPASTDPEARIHQGYRDDEPIGGFLFVEIELSGDTVLARFSLRNEEGREIYGRTYRAPDIPR